MPLPSFRHSKSKVRRRRSHDAVKPRQGVVCINCNAILMPHRACVSCGFYKGKQVVKGAKQIEKTLDKVAKKKATKVKESKSEKVEESKA